jgi:beta-mannanase
VTTTPVPPEPKPVVALRVGVSLDLPKLDAFIKTTGSTPSMFSEYQNWQDGETFDANAGFAAQEKGMGITITWEPWMPACNCVNQPTYSDRAIANGSKDSIIKAYADSLVDYASKGGGEVTIRLAHEMNGNWYPWGVGVNGNTGADYIAMWRHVHDIFAAEGVKNVLWNWAPNLTYTGGQPMAAAYPGDAYVDQVGLSGYNFGTHHYATWSSYWTSFTDAYQLSINTLRGIAPTKPLWLEEIGSDSTGGDKAAWITDMFAQIKARPYIAGFIWFDQSGPNSGLQDWLIEDDPRVLAAWRAGVASLQN